MSSYGLGRSLACRPRLFNWLHQLSLVGAFTTTTKEELEKIAFHAQGKNVAVEFGTFMGASAQVIAPALNREGVLYCVDPYFGGDHLYKVARRQLKRARVLDRIKFVRQISAESKAWLPPQVDFAFIDGDHSWEGIAIDWNLIRDLLRPGGIVCLHDTTPPPEDSENRCGSVRFFNDIIRSDPDFEWIDGARTLNVLRRKLVEAPWV